MPTIAYEGYMGDVEVKMDEVVYREDGKFVELESSCSSTKGPRYIPMDRVYHIDFEEDQ
jgi:hypothetical protein